MSNEADELSDLSDVVIEGGQRADGTEDATAAGDGGGEEFPGTLGGVDVSWLAEESKAVLAAAAPEQQAVIAEILDREHRMIQGRATERFNEAKTMREEAERLKTQAEFGDQIAQNPALLDRLLQAQQAQQPAAREQPLAEILEMDVSTPAGEAAMLEALRGRLGMSDIDALVDERVKAIRQEDPHYKSQRLVGEVHQMWSDFADAGQTFTPEQKALVGKSWQDAMRRAGKNPLDIDPSVARANLEAIASVVFSSSAAQRVTEPKRPPATNALPPSGGAGVSLKSQTPYDREKRPGTNDEILRYGPGGTLEDLERARRAAVGLPPED